MGLRLRESNTVNFFTRNASIDCAAHINGLTQQVGDVFVVNAAGLTEMRSELLAMVKERYVGKSPYSWPVAGSSVDLEAIEMTSKSQQEPAAGETKFTNTLNFGGTPVRDQLPAAKPEPQFDEIQKARHYNSHPSGVEAKHLLRLMQFNLGTAMKYVLRAGLKPGNDSEKDLSKAMFYVVDELENRTGVLVTGRSARVGHDLVSRLINSNREPLADDRHHRYWQGLAIQALWDAAYKDDQAALAGAVVAIKRMIGHMKERAEPAAQSTDTQMEHAS